jgi:hypothetical protein
MTTPPRLLVGAKSQIFTSLQHLQVPYRTRDG